MYIIQIFTAAASAAAPAMHKSFEYLHACGITL